MAWSILGTPVSLIRGGGGTAIPFSVTIPDGTQRVQVFVMYREGGGSGVVQPDGVTIGGAAATFLAYQAGALRGSNRIECWYLDSPGSGADLAASVVFTEHVNDVVIWTCCLDGLDLTETPVFVGGEESGTAISRGYEAHWAGAAHFYAGCGDGDAGPFVLSGAGWSLDLDDKTGTSQFADVSVVVAHRTGADPAATESFGATAQGDPTTFLWIEHKAAAGEGGIDVTISPAGVSATGSVGFVTVKGTEAIRVPVTGAFAAVFAGAVTVRIGRKVSVAGVSAFGRIGTASLFQWNERVVTEGGWHAGEPASSGWSEVGTAIGSWS